MISKYRVFDILTKKMYPVLLMDFQAGWVQWENGSARLVVVNTDGHSKLMCSTGKTDDCGFEMFDGDVVENDNGVWLEIYWNDKVGGFWQRVCSKKNVDAMGFTWCHPPTNLDLSFNFKKIVGNKYENPDMVDDNT